jgi:hypothetical protein
MNLHKEEDHLEKSHQLVNEYDSTQLKKVVLESRFAAEDVKGLLINKRFTIACIRDCFLRGEAAYASHVIYAQSHILDDYVSSERALGIQAGFNWGDCGEKTVVYTDLGISGGMKLGIEHAQKVGREVEYRELGFIPEVTAQEIELEETYIRSQQMYRLVLQEKINRPVELCLKSVTEEMNKPVEPVDVIREVKKLKAA